MPKPVQPEQTKVEKKATDTTEQAAPVNDAATQNRTTTVAPAEAPKSSGNTAPINESVTTDKVLVTVESKNYTMHIDTLGRVSKFYLNGERYTDEEGNKIELFGNSAPAYPMEVRFSNSELNSEAFKTNYQSDQSSVTLNGEAKTITLTQELSTTTVTKTITLYPSGQYDLNVKLSTPQNYYLTPGFRPSVVVDAYTVHGVRVKKKDGTVEEVEDGDAQGGERLIDLKFAADSDRYYTTFFYDLEGTFDIVLSADSAENPIIFTKGSENFSIKGFIGPKDYDLLESVDASLTEVIEYGMMTFMAAPIFWLLKELYGIFGNWGWAIVAVTILVRLVLYPLTHKGMVSMQKLKDLAPKMKELQAKYKGEPQKLNAKMMELYKKHDANPMGGCLPMLLQIPVFFAIYRVLLNAIELQHAPWILWINDLSVYDPYFILPILMGATMWYQQHISPTAYSDPMQEKIMKALPIIFTFFFVMFPAGLTLYWFVNNLFSIGQQWYINRYFEAQKAKRHEEHLAEKHHSKKETQKRSDD
jgi:YidC/Oxa1 family membrane protein insertase